MTVSYVEPPQADAQTREFYDRAESTFEIVLNIFKVFGHTPELGTVFTDTVISILKDGSTCTSPMPRSWRQSSRSRNTSRSVSLATRWVWSWSLYFKAKNPSCK